MHHIHSHAFIGALPRLAHRAGAVCAGAICVALRAAAMAAGLVLLAAAPVQAAETIGEVLERSHTLRLAALSPVPASDERVQVLQRSFDRVLARADGAAGLPIVLQVVTGPVLAETFHGRMVVVHADLAARPEGERLFVLAHEIGHVVHADWAAVRAVYRRHIPAEVVQASTDAVAALLGREMSALSHQQELDADAYALQVLGQLGHGIEAAQAVFARHGVQPDTATHPGTRKRMAWLRMAAP